MLFLSYKKLKSVFKDPIQQCESIIYVLMFSKLNELSV